MSIIPLPGGAHEEKGTKRTYSCSAKVLARGRSRKAEKKDSKGKI
jgi:hypothetical protein